MAKDLLTGVLEYVSPLLGLSKPQKDTATNVPVPIEKDKGIDDRPSTTNLPGRVSVPTDGNYNVSTVANGLSQTYRTINAKFLREIIPIIRSLCYLNPDVSQALDNIVSLGNTGHKIYFDRNVPDDQVDAMRNHIENKRKDWAPGQAGMDGLINKFFSQLMISGALSNEWVPDASLKGIESCILVNPENITFKLNNRTTKYEPYQYMINTLFSNEWEIKPIPTDNAEDGLIKLNTNTYRYYALNGDGELPYGIPPYLPVLPRVTSQNRMTKNIDYITDTMGLIGFLEVLLEKPSIQALSGEVLNEGQYAAKLEGLLTEAKGRIAAGLKDGVVVGYKGDHEFKFNSASKNFEPVTTLFQENELQVFSALKQDAALAGRGYATSETQITVVFNKLLSQLKNVQNIVKTNLEFGYSLELRLAGFKFNYLKVHFNRSTIQDDYKFQQAEELKIRNVAWRYVLGIINLNQAADELGYETPAEAKPLVEAALLIGKAPAPPAGVSGAPGAARKSQKAGAAKKTRSNNKPRG